MLKTEINREIIGNKKCPENRLLCRIDYQQGPQTCAYQIS